MNCLNCEHYNRGRGEKYCMTECEQYQSILRQSGKRKQVREELMPPELIDLIAVPENATDLKATLLILPPKLASVVTLRIHGNLNLAQIANELKISKSTVSRRIKRAASIMKRLL